MAIKEIGAALDRVARNTINDNFKSQDGRIDNLVLQAGDAHPELQDAHYSGVKGQTFATVGKRFDAVEQQAITDKTAANSELQSGLALKRDKSVMLTQADMSTASEAHKITPNHLNQAIKDMMSGSTPVSPNIADGQVTTEKLAKSAVTYDKLGADAQRKIDRASVYYDGFKDNYLHSAIKGGNNLNYVNLSKRMSEWTAYTPANASITDDLIILNPKENYENVYCQIDDTGLKAGDTIFFGCLLKSENRNCQISVYDIETNKTISKAMPVIGDGTFKFLSAVAVITGGERYGVRFQSQNDPTLSTIEMKNPIVLNLNRTFHNDYMPSREEVSKSLERANRSKKFEYAPKLNLDGLSVYAEVAGKVRVTQNYSTDKNLIIEFGKTGANNIYNLAKIELEDKWLKTRETFCDINTDWIGPYQVKAKNNANGDMPESHHYTGGNHAYDGGGGSGQTATGRTTAIKIWLDGERVVHTTNRNTNELRIEYTNRIQAMNTKKADGTGREVLEETVTIIMNRAGEIKVANKIRFLEDVNIFKYMGLQSQRHAWADWVRFESDLNNKMLAGDVAHDSLGADCDGVVLESTSHRLTLRIEGTGLRKQFKCTPSAYTTVIGKAYFILLSHSANGGLSVPFTANEIVTWRGSYLFENISI